MNFAYLCTACKHLVSGHTLVSGGELVAGPYACADCPCRIRQDSPMLGLSRTEFIRRFPNHPAAARV